MIMIIIIIMKNNNDDDAPQYENIKIEFILICDFIN